MTGNQRNLVRSLWCDVAVGLLLISVTAFARQCDSGQFHDGSACMSCSGSLNCQNFAGTTGTCSNGSANAECLALPGIVIENDERNPSNNGQPSEGYLFEGKGLFLGGDDIDPDPKLQSFTIRFSGHFTQQDKLSLNVSAWSNLAAYLRAEYNSATGTLAITAIPAEGAPVNAFFEAVERTKVQDYRTEPRPYREVEMQLNNGFADSDTVTVNVTTQFVNDKPSVVDCTRNETLIIDDPINGSATPSVWLFTSCEITDVEGLPTFTQLDVSVPGSGRLSYSGSLPSTFTEDGANTNSYKVTGDNSSDAYTTVILSILYHQYLNSDSEFTAAEALQHNVTFNLTDDNSNSYMFIAPVVLRPLPNFDVQIEANAVTPTNVPESNSSFPFTVAFSSFMTASETFFKTNNVVIRLSYAAGTEDFTLPAAAAGYEILHTGGPAWAILQSTSGQPLDFSNYFSYFGASFTITYTRNATMEFTCPLTRTLVITHNAFVQGGDPPADPALYVPQTLQNVNVTLNLLPENNEPTMFTTPTPSTRTYTEDTGQQPLNLGWNVTDADNSPCNFQCYTRLTASYDGSGSGDSFTYSSANFEITYDDGAGQLTGHHPNSSYGFSLYDLQAFLNGIMFQSPRQIPRQLQLTNIRLYESTSVGQSMCPNDTEGAMITLPDIIIDMIGVNDNPELAITIPDDGCSVKFYEETGARVPIANISLLNLTDVDLDPAGNEPNYVSVTVEIANYDSGDVLSAYVDAGSVPPGYTIYRQPGIITVTSNTSLTTSETLQVIMNIQYENANPNLNTDPRFLLLTVRDKDGGNGTLNITLCICPFDDPPVITFGANNQTNLAITYVSQKFVVEPIVPIGENATLVDVDDITLARLTCHLLEAPFAGTGREFLLFTTDGTNVTVDAGTPASFSVTYTLTGGLTTAEYSQVLRTMTYDNQQGELHGQAVRTVFCIADDGQKTGSANVSITIEIIEAPPFQNWTNPAVHELSLAATGTCTAVFTSSYTILAGETDFLQRMSLSIRVPPNEPCTGACAETYLIIPENAVLSGLSVSGNSTTQLNMSLTNPNSFNTGVITTTVTVMMRQVLICSSFESVQVVSVHSFIEDWPTARVSNPAVAILNIAIGNHRPFLNLTASTCPDANLTNYLPILEGTGAINVADLLQGVVITDLDAGDNHTLVVVNIMLSPPNLKAQFQFRPSAANNWVEVDPNLAIPSPTQQLIASNQYRVLPGIDFEKLGGCLSYTLVAYDFSNAIDNTGLFRAELPYSKEMLNCRGCYSYINRVPRIQVPQFVMPTLIEDLDISQNPEQVGTGPQGVRDVSLYNFRQLMNGSWVRPVAIPITNITMMGITDDDDTFVSLAVEDIPMDDGIWMVNHTDGSSEVLTKPGAGNITIIPRSSALFFIPRTHFYGMTNLYTRGYDGPAGPTLEEVIRSDYNAHISTFRFTITQPVSPINDIPLIDLNGPAELGLQYQTEFIEESPWAVSLSSDLFILDPDVNSMENATVCLSPVPDGNYEYLNRSVRNPAITASEDRNSERLCVLLTGTAPKETYQQVLSGIGYINTADEPNATPRSVTFAVDDGTHSSTPIDTNITIIFTNDAPELTFENGQLNNTVAFVEGYSPISILTNSTLSDDDSTIFHSVVVILSNRESSAEMIHSTLSSVFVEESQVVDATTIRYNFSGSASTADVQAFIRALVYNNTVDEPSLSPRVVTTVVYDDMWAASAAVTTTIHIQPINDNRPIFEQNYRACVPEGARGHQVLLNVSATDADHVNQPAQSIWYDLLCPLMNISLGSASGDMLLGPLTGTVAPPVTGEGDVKVPICDIFMINRQTGQITTCNDSLCVVPRRQVRPEFRLNITADDGVPPPGKTMLTIETRESNIHAPVFAAMTSTGVHEGDTGFLKNIEATDQDTMAPNNAISFHFGESVNQTIFHLAENGTLSLLRPLNFESRCHYDLEVIVSDGRDREAGCFFGGVKSSTALVSITVFDRNEFTPIFQPPPPAGGYTTNYQEESNNIIFDFNATDGDEGCFPDLTQDFSFSLSDTYGGLFHVNASTGVLTHTGRLDRDNGTTSYNITVHVTDIGGLTSTTQLIIYLLDINDNSPTFSEPSYSAEVPEQTVLLNFLHIQATDPDEGPNADLGFTLFGAPSSITVNSSGWLSINDDQLDFENGPRQYEFTVRAKDGGTMSRESNTTVIITLLDLNDNLPILVGLANKDFFIGQRSQLLAQQADIRDNDSHIHPISGLRVSIESPVLSRRTHRPCDCDVGPFGTCTNVTTINVLERMAGDVTPVDGVATFTGSSQSSLLYTSLATQGVIAGCFKLDAGETTFGYLITVVNGGDLYIGLQVHVDRLVYRYRGETTVHTVNLPTGIFHNTSEWHSFGLNVNFPAITLHIDGFQVYSNMLTARPVPIPNQNSQLIVGCHNSECFRGMVRRLIFRAGMRNLLYYADDLLSGVTVGVPSPSLMFQNGYARVPDKFQPGPHTQTTSLTIKVRFSLTIGTRGTLVSQGIDKTWRIGVVAQGSLVDVYFRTCPTGSPVNRGKFSFPVSSRLDDGRVHTILVQLGLQNVVVYVNGQLEGSSAYTAGNEPCFAVTLASDDNSFYLGAHFRSGRTPFLPLSGVLHDVIFREGIISPIEWQCLDQGCGNCRCGGRCDNIPACSAADATSRCQFNFGKYAQCDVVGAFDLIALAEGKSSGCNEKDLSLNGGGGPIFVTREKSGLPSSFYTFSVAFWFRFGSSTSGEVLVVPGVFAVRILPYSLVLAVATRQGTDIQYQNLVFTSNFALNSSTLIHAAITSDGAHVEAYINGDHIGHRYLFANHTTVVSGNLYIGSWPRTAWPSFVGELRGLIVTTSVLSRSQILCIESCGHFLTVWPSSFANTSITDASGNPLHSAIDLRGRELETNYSAALRTIRYFNLATNPSQAGQPSTSHNIKVEVFDNSTLVSSVTQTIIVTVKPAYPPQLLAGGHTVNHYVRLTRSGQVAPLVADTVQALLPPGIDGAIYINITIMQGCREDDRIELLYGDSPCFNITMLSTTEAQVHVAAPYCLLTTALRLLRYHCASTSQLVSQPSLIRSVLFFRNSTGDIVTAQYAITNVTADSTVDPCLPNPCNYGGTCTSRGDMFNCTCAAGFTGSTCETNINECEGIECENSGTCVDLVQDFRCNCVPGFTGRHCQDNINDCLPRPCENGGTCTDLINAFNCSCADGYTGANCSVDINECMSNPCLHGATCNDLVNSFNCTCAPGFVSANCSVDFDECSSGPCRFGGTCHDMINGYTCSCVLGYTGTHCEENINDCHPDPCKNGTCSDLVNDYRCTCREGFTGKNCSENIGECISSPCINGTCHDQINGYTCACTGGFTGIHCETNIDECPVNNTCTGRGTCVDGVADYVCNCALGFTGKNCEVDIDYCESHTCLNGGTQREIVQEERCVCDCPILFTGSNCQTMLEPDCDFNNVITDQTTLDTRVTPCREIRGTLTVSCEGILNCDITNLRAFRNTEHIDSLTITTVPGIETLAGLEAVQTATSLSILDMNSLTSLSGWMASQEASCSVTMTNLIIKGNNRLTNLTGLGRIRSLGTPGSDLGLTVEDNNGLTSVQGLNCLSNVVHLRILNNMVLTNLQALQSLTTVGGLSIQGNMILQSLEGLHNLAEFTTVVEVSAPVTAINLEGLRGLARRGQFYFTANVCYQSGGTVTKEHLRDLPHVGSGFFFVVNGLPQSSVTCP